VQTALSEPLVVTVRTVYALSMSQTILIRLKGIGTPEAIEADQIENDGPYLVLRKGSNIVAKFKESEVVGWVIDQR
jgi:hypothetical protein